MCRYSHWPMIQTLSGSPKRLNNWESEIPDSPENKWLYFASGQKKGVLYSWIVTCGENFSFLWLAQDAMASTSDGNLGRVLVDVSGASCAKYCESEGMKVKWRYSFSRFSPFVSGQSNAPSALSTGSAGYEQWMVIEEQNLHDKSQMQPLQLVLGLSSGLGTVGNY